MIECSTALFSTKLLMYIILTAFTSCSHDPVTSSLQVKPDREHVTAVQTNWVHMGAV